MTRQFNIDNAFNERTTRTTGYNSGFAKRRIQWLIEPSTSNQFLCYVDSFVTRNSILLKATNVIEK